MGHILTPRYGVMPYNSINTEYSGEMRTFFAVPGTTGTSRLKIRPDEDTTEITIKYKTTYWDVGDTISDGTMVDKIMYYKSGTTYTENDWIIYQGDCYRSLQNSNIGNTPDTSASFWINTSDLDNNEWYEVTGLTDDVKYYYKCFLSNGVYKVPKLRPADIVYEYKLDYNSGDTISTNDGADTSVEYVAREPNYAGVFNGSSSYIDLGTPSTFDRTVKTAGNGCAYECWVNLDAWGSDAGANSDRILVDKNGWDCMFLSDASEQISALKYIGSSLIISKTGLSLNTWYHLIMNVYSDYSFEFFVDGISVGMNTNTTIPSNVTTGMSIGADPVSAQFCNGKIDNVRFYNHFLTTSEITDNYNANADYYAGLPVLYEEPTSLPTSLVHHYKLDQDATDLAGSNDGIATGVTYEIVNNIVKECAEFNGLNSYIDLGTPSTFNRAVKSAGNGCAYECWILANSWGNDTGVGSKRPLEDRHGWLVNIMSSASGTILFSKAASTVYQSTSVAGLSTETWYHIVGNVKPDYSLELYVNGVLEDTNSNTTIPDTYSNAIAIGQSGELINYACWDGKIDNVRLYSRSLTSYEVADLYNDTFEYYKDESMAIGGGGYSNITFDNIVGTTIYDEWFSSNASNTNGTFATGKIGNSWYGNGSNARINLPIYFDGFLFGDFTIAFKLRMNNGSIGYVFHFPYDCDVQSFYNGSLYRFFYGGAYRVSCEIGYDEWYDVVITRSTTSGIKLYVNGILCSSNTYTGSPGGVSSNYPISIASNYNYTSYTDLSIDSWLVFDRTLRKFELDNLLNNGQG